jgi:hypothetical protein
MSEDNRDPVRAALRELLGALAEKERASFAMGGHGLKAAHDRLEKAEAAARAAISTPAPVLPKPGSAYDLSDKGFVAINKARKETR